MTNKILYEICRKDAEDWYSSFVSFDTKTYESYTDAVHTAFEMWMQDKSFNFVVFPVGEVIDEKR